MESGNQTHALEFLLLGFSAKSEIRFILFGLFLSMYLVTFTGNLLIILAIVSDSHLHTPMYFFLSNLSFADICFTSTTIPKMLLNLQTQSKVITYKACLSQIFFFIVFGCLDNLFLTMMAYDRFVAICHPLHYTVIMNSQVCGLLVLGSWCLSVMGSLIETLTILRLSFCTNLEIPHFFCDLPEVLKLTCSDTLINNIVVYFATGLLAVIPFSGILFSYYQIVSSILRISSAGGKFKAFSTCGAHLLVVFLFYGTGLGVYLSSAGTSSSRTSLVASVMYTMVTPMLNPFIYSLRNRDMKGALGRLLSRATSLSNAAIILTSLLDSRCHTPMYFFFPNLSILDMCFTNCIVPQIMYSVALAFGSMECVLFTVLVVDHYVVICWSLHSATIMHQQICHLLVAMSLFTGLANSLLQASLSIVWPLCDHCCVDYFLFDVLVIIKLLWTLIQLN
ncbi:hypothetical protein E2I00_019627 [Balaenoptera physalus]|uniref:G-protein coupled receptors family 1 profile domain-containing protein n=1 Tax=Balaenoptera physalus TaxID=9770 RepID=A0A643C4N6_BALPH|nr:hypothetical protein E2I00_019627 [Balaenoptera physalus]